MGRKKVPLAWVRNEAARKASMKKRRLSLMKKVEELSILCGVQTFCIIRSPDDDVPMVFPNDHGEAGRALERFLAMPAFERSKGTTTQESYLRDQINKLQGRREAHLERVNKMELDCLMDEAFYGKGLDGLGLPGLDCLSLLLKEKLGEIRKKAEFYSDGVEQGPSKRAKRDPEGGSSVNHEVEGNGVVFPQNSVANVAASGGDGDGYLYDVVAGFLGDFTGGGGGGDFQLQPDGDTSTNNTWPFNGVFPPME